MQQYSYKSGLLLRGAYVCKTEKQYKSAQNLAQGDEIAVKMINYFALIPSNLNTLFLLKDLYFLHSPFTDVSETPSVVPAPQELTEGLCCRIGLLSQPVPMISFSKGSSLSPTLVLKALSSFLF